MASRALVVGVNTQGLRFAVQDANLMRETLEGFGYEVLEPETNKQDILGRFDALIDTAMHTDTVIVYFSGHGILDRGRLQYLIGENASRASNKLNLTDLIADFNDCKAVNKLVILDCCHANAGTKDWQIDGSDRYRILTASERLQKTTETDELGASFFTYQLVTLLKEPPADLLDAQHQIHLNNFYEVLRERIQAYNAKATGEPRPLPNLLGNQKHNFSIGRHATLSEHADERQAKTSAERRYRELALKACDIVDLANLPEDKAVSTRKLVLRRLYVPLRVVVDVKQRDGEGVEATFSRIERNRRVYEEIDPDQRYPLGERLGQACRLAVLGDPGAGKSTLLRWMTTAYLLRLDSHPDWQNLPDIETLPDENWLPILIRCRDLDKTALAGTLEDMLARTFRKSEMSKLDAAAFELVVREKMQAGQVLLLIDGLDEIGEATARAHFCRQIERIADAYENVPIIVTSRIVGYREMGYRLGSGFQHTTVADLSSDDKDLFARQWCELTEPPERQVKATSDLIEAIHSSDRIEQLTSNPMLLTTMALVKRRVGKLPTRRAELYFEAVRVLLVWRTDVDEVLDYREAEPQLRYIAYAMSHRGTQTLREDELLGFLTQMRIEYPNLHDIHQHMPREFLQIVERRTGILIQAGYTPHEGQSEPVYEFRHLTFQEYLAGMALVKKQFPGCNVKQSLADYVAPLAGRIDEAYFNPPMVRRIDINVNRAVVTESWREPLRICVYSCDSDVADETLLAILHPLPTENLEQTTRPRTVLAALCLADEPNVSNSTAKIILAEFSKVVEKEDGEETIQTLLFTAAVELATSRWFNDLLDSLITTFLEHDNEQRMLGVGGLMGIVVSRIRNAAAQSDEVWLEQQIKLLMSPDAQEKVVSALALMEYCFSESANAVALVVESADPLIALITESKPLAFAATWALMWLSNSNLQTRQWNPTPIQRKKLCIAVEKAGLGPFSIHFLSLVFENAKMNEAVGPLVSKLDDEDADFRRAVAAALGRIGSEEAVEPLVSKLDDEDAAVRRAVAEALGSIGSEEAVEPLVSRLDDEDADVWYAVAEALGSIGSEEAVEPLVSRLDHEDAAVRRAVAEALGSSGSEEAVEPLVSRLDHEDADVWYAVAEALGSIGSEEAVEPLVSRLDHEDAAVRRVVAEALGSSGSEEAVEPLVSRLDDEVAVVRGITLANLVKLDSRFDEVDLTIISKDLDAIAPFLDPQDKIEPSHLNHAAKELKISLEDVNARVAALAAAFELPLI